MWRLFNHVRNAEWATWPEILALGARVFICALAWFAAKGIYDRWPKIQKAALPVLLRLVKIPKEASATAEATLDCLRQLRIERMICGIFVAGSKLQIILVTFIAMSAIAFGNPPFSFFMQWLVIMSALTLVGRILYVESIHLGMKIDSLERELLQVN